MVFQPDAGGQLGIGAWLGYAIEKPALHGPYPTSGDLRLYGTLGTTGSRSGTLAFSAPGLRGGWRALAVLRSERLLRTPFFGVLNEERQDDTLQEANGLYYRYALRRNTAYATLQRRLAGPVWLMVAGQARTWRTSSLRQQPSLYVSKAASPVVDTLRFNGLEARGGLVVDTRDEWNVPTRGMLLELIGATGSVDDRTASNPTPVARAYRRVLLAGREFIRSAGGRTVLALRQRATLSPDTLPFFLAWERVTSWMPDDGIAGGRSLRLHGGGSQLGSNDVLVSVELRRKLMVPPYDADDPAALWGMAFVDAGAMWENHESGKRNVWTAGVGMRLQTSRTGVIGFDVGMADTGFNLSVLSYFAF